jgi:hypothetical protein
MGVTEADGALRARGAQLRERVRTRADLRVVMS